METKVCSKCGIEQPLNSFHKRHDRPCGIVSKCKKCFRDYYKDNHEVIARRTRKYIENHNEEVCTYRRKYHREHREKILLASRALYRKNKDRHRKKQQRQDAESPEKAAAHHAVSYAIASGALIPPKRCSINDSSCLGKIHAHHDDYSKPLEVRWLCAAHHHQFHSESTRRL